MESKAAVRVPDGMGLHPRQRKRKQLWIRVKRYQLCYVMLIPLLAFLAIFRYTPMVSQFLLAVKDYRFVDGILKSPFVGMEHFRRMLDSVTFYEVLRNTLVISVLKLFWGFWPPIVLALMLNELRSKAYRQISQTIVYLPNFLSWVIVYGIINNWITALGGQPIDIITSIGAFRPTIIITYLWKTVGWGTIIYLAALSGVDPELYDSAAIDGANVWQRLLHITLPGIQPIIVFVLTLSMGSILNAGFEQIFLFQTSATYAVSDTLETWVYRRGLQDMEYSFATAVSIFQGVIGLLLVMGSNWLANKTSGTGIW